MRLPDRRAATRRPSLCDAVGRNAKMTLGQHRHPTRQEHARQRHPRGARRGSRHGDLPRRPHRRQDLQREAPQGSPGGRQRDRAHHGRLLPARPAGRGARQAAAPPGHRCRSRHHRRQRPPRGHRAGLPRKTADEIDDELAERVASGELEEAAGRRNAQGPDRSAQTGPLPAGHPARERARAASSASPFRCSSGSGVPKRPARPSRARSIRLVYLDKRHLGEGTSTRTAEAKVIEGNLGEMRVTRTEISDEELQPQNPAPHRLRPHRGRQPLQGIRPR